KCWRRRTRSSSARRTPRRPQRATRPSRSRWNRGSRSFPVRVAFCRVARKETPAPEDLHMDYANILTKAEDGVGVGTLNRPHAMNALNSELLAELCDALEKWDGDDAVRCIVVTGSERAFAAGADIKEMQPRSYMDMFKANFFADAAERIAAIRKPIIAAVAGYALG